jgi:hypothetical protein
MVACALRTVTLKLHSAVPQPFEAMQVTFQNPSGKTEPEGGLQTTNVPAGVTAGAKVTVALLLQVSTLISVGHWICGGLPFGITTTVKLQESFSWHRSSAVQVTMFVPHGNKLPEGGLQVTETLPLLSEAAGGG